MIKTMMEVAVVAAIVLGCILIILIVVGGVIFSRWSKKSRTENHYAHQSAVERDNQYGNNGPESPTTRN
jgi:hypothetical protein